MRTKSKGDLIAQIERIRKIFCQIPNWHKEPIMGQMILAQEICEKYHNNINDFLGDYDVQNDEAEFHRRYDLQMPSSIYAKK